MDRPPRSVTTPAEAPIVLSIGQQGAIGKSARPPPRRNRLRAGLAIFGRAGNSESTAHRLNLTILASLLILVANLGSGIVLARALGPTGRGIVTAAMLFGPLIANVGGLGIADALVYRSGRADKTKSPALVTALYIGAVQSLILVLAGWIVVPALLRGPTHQALSAALAYLAIIPLFFLSQYPLAVLQGRLRMAEFNFVRVSVPLIYTAGLLMLWRLGAMSVQAVLVTSLVSAAVACVVALAGAAAFSTRRARLPEARELLKYGLRTHGGNLAAILVSQLDLLMLAAMVPIRDLGLYAVATSAAMTGSVIPMAASLVLFPTFASQSTEARTHAMARFLMWGLGGAILIAPVLVLVVPWAVGPIYGGAFNDARGLCVALVPAYLLRGSNQMLVAILRGSGAPLRASLGQILGLAMLAVGLPTGISVAGTEGAAIAVLASAAATFAWLLIASWRHAQLSSHGVIAVWNSDMSRLGVFLKAR